MKPEESFDDFLAQHLRQSQTYLPDDGFSAQVMQALPQPKARNRWAELLIIGIPLLVISVLVFAQFPFASVFGGLWYWVIQMGNGEWLQLGMAASLCVMLTGVTWFFREA